MTKQVQKFANQSKKLSQGHGLIFGDYDCIIDLRSTGSEHWSFNYGIVNAIVNSSEMRRVEIRTTQIVAGILLRLGINAKSRLECSTVAIRAIRLLCRELLSAFEVIRAGLFSKKIFVLHCHPIGLCFAWPVLLVFGSRFTICLHNDFLGALRESGREQRIEKWLWWCVARLNRRIIFAAQNKSFARYARKFFPSLTHVEVCPHPVLSRETYKKLAQGAQMDLPTHAHQGYFGRVESSRGMLAFESYVATHPEEVFIVAGIGASKFPKYANVYSYEQPSVEVYSALAIRCDSIFLDLNSEVYRIGESGVFWDAVGLNVPVLLGALPAMHRARLKKYFDRRFKQLA